MSELQRVCMIVAQILQAEEADCPDWEMIKFLSDQEIMRLNESGSWIEIDDALYHFLEDYDVRKKDVRYGKSQRDEARRRIRTIETSAKH